MLKAGDRVRVNKNFTGHRDYIGKEGTVMTKRDPSGYAYIELENPPSLLPILDSELTLLSEVCFFVVSVENKIHKPIFSSMEEAEEYIKSQYKNFSGSEYSILEMREKKRIQARTTTVLEEIPL